MSELEELRQLELISRAVDRRAVSQRTGAVQGILDESLDEHQRSIRDRADICGIEATETILLFLRQLFAQKKDLMWKEGEGGQTHPESKIVIESVFSIAQREYDPKTPTLMVRPGPNSNPETVIGGLKHYDFMTDTRTYSDLEVGTIRIDCSSVTGAGALMLSSFIKMAILTLSRANENLSYRSFHKITNVTGGGYDPRAAAYNRQSEAPTNASVPVTFTYYWQYTTRVSPREGVYDFAEEMAVSMGVLPEYDGESFVDDATDGVVELRETLVVLPVELDEDLE